MKAAPLLDCKIENSLLRKRGAIVQDALRGCQDAKSKKPNILPACLRMILDIFARQTTAKPMCNNRRVMATITAPTITALQAQAEANLFLSDHLPDRFMAGQPGFDAEANVWRVPVLLAYAIIGPVGQTGEILVSANSEEIVSYTSLEEMKAAARTLYEQHRDAIEAPVP